MMKTKPMVSVLVMALCGLLMLGGTALADTVVEGSATLESLHTNGTQGDSNSQHPSISADGRYIAFQSYATTLIGNDTNSASDIFLRDTAEGITTLVSVAASYGAYGYGANSGSFNAAISGNGRYVAFDSYATNLVAGGTYGQQVFIQDTTTGITELVSPNYGGAYGAYGYGANGESCYPSVSFDGRYVAFQSGATNLTAGTDSNGYMDIFIRDTQAGATTRVLAYGGAEPNNSSSSPAMAGDGSSVAFQSNATNLLAANNPDGVNSNIFVYDTAAGTIELISRAYGSDFTEAASYGADSSCYYPAISYGGRYVAFASIASNLVYGGGNGYQQVFVYDRTTGDMVVASAQDDGTAMGDSGSYYPSISHDGRYVAFTSYATNLAVVDNATGSYRFVYLRDTVDNQTTLISRVDNTVGGYGAGTYGGNAENGPSVSACGMYVAFDAYGSYFVEDDTNGNSDVFRVLYDTDGDGIGDMDADGDGTPDCVDLCPDDPDKIEPGACGCGVADTDSDGDGTPDCLEEEEPAPAPLLPDTESSLDCFISSLLH
ncbi:MAG: hypothetical protein ACOZBW_01775 [Thermodesulfobacteriota bacterium]